MTNESASPGLAVASDQARAIRELYHQLEMDSMGRTWTVEEDLLGLMGDAGLLSRLVLAAQGTWPKNGDVPAELRHKLAECLWWVLVLSDRLGVDIDGAFDEFASRQEADLGHAVADLASAGTSE